MSPSIGPIQVPAPAEIRRRLAEAVAEARALRRLLRLAEAACDAQRAKGACPLPAPGQEGRRNG
jgi:hypothetical protein